MVVSNIVLFSPLSTWGRWSHFFHFCIFFGKWMNGSTTNKIISWPLYCFLHGLNMLHQIFKFPVCHHVRHVHFCYGKWGNFCCFLATSKSPFFDRGRGLCPCCPKAKLGPPAEAGSSEKQREGRQGWKKKQALLGFGDGEHILKDGIYDIVYIYIYITVYIVLVWFIDASEWFGLSLWRPITPFQFAA